MKRSFTRTMHAPSRLPRPSTATAIALVALVMAMGGTSLAGTMISGSTLKNRSVTGKKIAVSAIDSTLLAANSVTTPKLARGSVSASKIADAAVTKAALAAGSVTSSALAAGSVTSSALAAGSVTSSALAAGSVSGTNLAPSSTSWKSLGAQVVAAAPVVLPVGTTSYVPATATASCPSGTVAISGGATVSDTTYGFVIQAFQGGPPGAVPTGWTATGATGGATASTMTVYAICISAGQ